MLLNFGEVEFDPEIAKVEESVEVEEEEAEAEIISVIEFIIGDLLEDEIEFDDEVFSIIYKEYAEAFENDKLLKANYFVNHEDERVRKTTGDLLAENHSLSPLWFEKHQISITPENDTEVVARACFECIYSLKINKISEMKKNLLASIAVQGLSVEQQNDILVKYRNYDKMQNELNVGLGRFIGGKS